MPETPTDRELAALRATVEHGGYGPASLVLPGPIAPATVRSHVRAARQKLDAHTTAQAFAIAVARGLIDVREMSFRRSE